METQTFLDNFATVADAPGGVQRLRELVLELAFRGRLTTADVVALPNPSPGPISAPLSSETAPFEIPGHWAWHRLDEIADYNKRPKVSPDSLPPTAWSLDLEDIEKTTSALIRRVSASERPSKSTKCAFEPGDVLNGKLRPYLDKVLVADWSGYCTTEIVPIVPRAGIDSHYLRWSLKRPDFRRSVESASYGMKMPRLGTKDALASCHPVPPLAEQEWIVAKVDELMALCDDLEARQEQRHHANTRFRGSALNALTEAETPDALRHAWERVNANWQALTDHSGSVSSLCQTFRDLAVSGRIATGTHHSDDLCDDEFFSALDDCPESRAWIGRLPPGWKCVPLGELLADGVANGISPKPAEHPTTVMSLKLSATTKGFFDQSQSKYVDISEETAERYWLRPGDLLIQRSNTPAFVGMAALYSGPERTFIYPDLMMRGRIRPEVHAGYVHQCLLSTAARSYMRFRASGTSQSMVKVNQKSVLETPIPLPDRAQQERLAVTIHGFVAGCVHLDRALVSRTAAGDGVAVAVLALN